MKAVYRWIEAGTLDVRIQVTPQKDIPDFELFLSSYLTTGFRAAVYVQQEGKSNQGCIGDTTVEGDSSGGLDKLDKLNKIGKQQFVPVHRPPNAKSGYVIYPRDEKALRMIQDGRWKIPPSPVDWDVGPFLARPICFRRDAQLDITVVLMSPAEDCFAISSAWNPATPEAKGYRSLYLSLFGRNIQAGETAVARCRLLIGRDLTEPHILEIYEKYTKEVK